MCRHRAETVSTKESATLEWRDDYGGHGALFDLAVNVGLCSRYYAKAHPGTVDAFELSVLGMLANNVSANDVPSRIVVLPNPLTSQNMAASFHLTLLAAEVVDRLYGAGFELKERRHAEVFDGGECPQTLN